MSEVLWRVPSEVARTGASLLDQQCWCWGQDVLHPAGNYLLRAGFTQEKSDDPQVPSRYRRDGFVLWAFGVFYGAEETGGLLLARQGFRARLTETHLPPPIWTLRDATTRYPKTPDECAALRVLLHQTLLFFADYEERAQAELGFGWRTAAIANWQHKTVAARLIASEWRRLASLVA